MGLTIRTLLVVFFVLTGTFAAHAEKIGEEEGVPSVAPAKLLYKSYLKDPKTQDKLLIERYSDSTLKLRVYQILPDNARLVGEKFVRESELQIIRASVERSIRARAAVGYGLGACASLLSVGIGIGGGAMLGDSIDPGVSGAVLGGTIGGFAAPLTTIAASSGLIWWGIRDLRSQRDLITAIQLGAAQIGSVGVSPVPVLDIVGTLNRAEANAKK